MERRKLKEKAKRIATIIGKVAICGFALFGAVCAGILVGNAAMKGNGAEAPRSSKAMRVAEPSANLLADLDVADAVTINPTAMAAVPKTPALDWSVGFGNWWSAGWYCYKGLDADNARPLVMLNSSGVNKVYDVSEGISQNAELLFEGSDYRSVYYATEAGTWFYLSDDAIGGYLSFCVNVDVDGVNAIGGLSLTWYAERPKLATLELRDDWSPAAWVSRQSVGGFPLVFTSYVTKETARNGSVRVGWDDVTFTTENDARYFDGLRVTFRWMWDGLRYKVGDEVGSFDYDARLADGYPLFPSMVEFRDAESGRWSSVAEQAWEWQSASTGVATASMHWVNAKYQKLTFYAAPTNPTYLTICQYSVNAGGSYSPFPAMTYYGLTFGDWFGLESSWASPSVIDVGTGNALALVGDAFASIIPILSIQILPNISLGLLIFLPLIAGIVVLIIKVVSK